jgi:hypothetical protein
MKACPAARIHADQWLQAAHWPEPGLQTSMIASTGLFAYRSTVSLFILILGRGGYGLVTGGMSAGGRTKPLVGEAITTIVSTCPGASMLFYRAALPLSRQTLSYVAGIIRRHRARSGSCWRKLNPGQQALLVLALLRKGETLTQLAVGFGVGTATAWRYVTEIVQLLAARSPKLGPALRAARQAGHAFVVIDGTLIAIDRVAKDRPSCSGRHRRHGMNLQVISSPAGDILWVSGPLPGSVHDLTAARIWGILREPAAAGLLTLTDKGYISAGQHVLTPYRGRGKPPSQKAASRAYARLRSPGERANAQLKSWHILRKLRCCPWKTGQLAKAIHVLQARETAG